MKEADLELARAYVRGREARVWRSSGTPLLNLGLETGATEAGKTTCSMAAQPRGLLDDVPLLGLYKCSPDPDFKTHVFLAGNLPTRWFSP